MYPLPTAHIENPYQPFLFGDFHTVETENTGTIAERAQAFHEANPHVYRALVQLATDMQRRGRTRWSINGAFEVLRWSAAMTTEGDEFKLNNDFRAFYARLIMDRVPELDGFFEVRSERCASHTN